MTFKLGSDNSYAFLIIPLCSSRHSSHQESGTGVNFVQHTKQSMYMCLCSRILSWKLNGAHPYYSTMSGRWLPGRTAHKNSICMRKQDQPLPTRHRNGLVNSLWNSEDHYFWPSLCFLRRIKENCICAKQEQGNMKEKKKSENKGEP